ncbi:hypothetical protein [Teredinibacter waterburyi]|uniref:hypothetical protein n=1 Tax=Teredinibacter waterburyi TaxID=1500538 RepID=UPI00165F1E81|nr:hypothetical protein [Teredinibacter waterburyi]
MIRTQTIRNTSGALYKFHLQSDGIVPAGLKSIRFTGELHARAFINSFPVDLVFWRELGLALTTDVRTASQADLLNRLAAAMYRQPTLRVFEVTAFKPSDQIFAKTQVKQTGGLVTQFVPASEKLASGKAATPMFGEKKVALAFVEKVLAPADSEQIASIYALTSPTATAGAAPSVGTDAMLDRIADALCNGELGINESRMTPSGKESSADNSADESSSSPPPANSPGNRAAPLAPEATESCGVCTATDLVIKCGHGRTQNPKGLLRVVPSTDTTKTKDYELMGVKVSIKHKYNGRDKIECSLTLAKDKLATCPQISDDGTSWTNSKTKTIETYKKNSDPDNWTIDISPKTTQIQAKGCDGSVVTRTLETYPSDEYSITGNLDIFASWAEEINEAWKTWGKTVFSLSPVKIVPKITGPTGSFSAAWGWKEASDWDTYYDVSAEFGLDPILGVEIEASISFVELALTAAGLPPPASTFAAKHLADMQIFCSAGCSGSLTGSPHKQFYPDGGEKTEGEANFKVEGNVTLGARARAGSDYVISVELEVNGSVKVEGKDTLKLDNTGLHAQTTVNVEPFVGVAKYKIKYMKIKSKSGQKEWKPWSKYELYKSANKKIFPR